MAAGLDDEEPDRTSHDAQIDQNDEDSSDEETENDNEDDEDEDEEPKLKYARLTSSLGGVYRNGDATSAFLVAGDKMIVGTHSGNTHVLLLPTFQPLKVYQAHTASITAVSISPNPPPLPTAKPDAVSRVVSQSTGPLSPSSSSKPPASPKSPRHQPPVPAVPSNIIHIATSSIDGNICVASLVDPKDVHLRNFGRPVQAVALSPEFKNDRSYLSGGLAGNLILTVGGKPGTSSTSNLSGGSAAAASGWLGSIGLGSNTGKDTILHSGEGAISIIKWSLSGKFVVWVNEKGIKIMRSNLSLESADSESAWKRISHIDHPDLPGWEENAGIWKPRLDWVDETVLEQDYETSVIGTSNNSSNGHEDASTSKKQDKAKKIEKLVVGWGGTVWIIRVHPGGKGIGKDVGERFPGKAEIVTILRTDCIISGLSLYTPSLLLVLAYVLPEESQDAQEKSVESSPRGGRHKRQNALSPELRIIDLSTKEEISADTLTISRYETLSATDYHLSALTARTMADSVTSRGALEAIGGGFWEAGASAGRLFSSGASVFSNGDSKSVDGGSIRGAKGGAGNSMTQFRVPGVRHSDVSPALSSPGMKVFIHSPYDCVLATKRDLSDHLEWLTSREKFQEAWQLISEHPEVVSPSQDSQSVKSGSVPATPTKAQGTLAEFLADDDTDEASRSARDINSAVEKEKRRVGEQWIQQLIGTGDWKTAGEVCGKVLGTSSRWEHWVWTFAQANKFEEITPYIPTSQLKPPLPSLVYEVVLGHYIAHDRIRFQELLEQWPTELFDIHSIASAIEGRLKAKDIREDTVEGGEAGRDWRILTEALAKLYIAEGRPRDALRCYIRLKDGDAALDLIRTYHLLDAISDDIPGLILLRVSKERMQNGSIAELEEATREPISLLVDEAHHGVVGPDVVVEQLEKADYLLFLYFYLRALWLGPQASPGDEEDDEDMRVRAPQSTRTDKLAQEGLSLLDSFADLAVTLFAEYSRPLLLRFLQSSTAYTYSHAATICETRDYIPELVYLLSKTGQVKRALFLIIDKLQDVGQAISFAKQQDDADLWDDLLDYSMDKPRFIRGLLEQVGTAIDPITLVRRIPEGLEIEGLRDGLARMLRDYEIQSSISEGVARVLRSEVASGMDILRTGQKRGLKFDVPDLQSSLQTPSTEITAEAPTIAVTDGESPDTEDAAPPTQPSTPAPGHCTHCKLTLSPTSSAEGDLDASPPQEESLLIFANCAHAFHLSCLLRRLDVPEREIDDIVVAMAPRAGGSGATRSVGAKVTHARLVREKLERYGEGVKGCPVCKKVDEADDVQ